MSARTGSPEGYTVKGWHVLAMLVAFFGVVISVNIYMAMMASKSWTGLYSKNGYVASQEFNQSLRDAEIQRERGWRSGIAYKDGALTLTFHDRDGNPLRLDHVRVEAGHPVAADADRSFELSRSGDGIWTGGGSLSEGRWYITVDAAQGGVTYHREARLFVNARGEGRLE